jgi:4'-phosphopantetheinyl transferase EntD
MPEIWRKDEPNYHIIIWQSTEPVEELLNSARLNEQDFSEFSSFKSDTRKREWVTVRTALHALLPGENQSISYDSHGKPTLYGDRSISISHSGEFIAVMIAEGSRIGIDIEVIHPRIETLSRKFVNERERDFINQDVFEKLHIIWGAKEVLFKVYSLGGLDFRKDMLVEPFEYQTNGSCHAFIKKKLYEKNFHVYYQRINQYMVVWTVED